MSAVRHCFPIPSPPSMSIAAVWIAMATEQKTEEGHNGTACDKPHSSICFSHLFFMYSSLFFVCRSVLSLTIYFPEFSLVEFYLANLNILVTVIFIFFFFFNQV